MGDIGVMQLNTDLITMGRPQSLAKLVSPKQAKTQPHTHQVRDCWAEGTLVPLSGKKDHGSYYLISLNEHVLSVLP